MSVISKEELIHECVTVPSCCCCIQLLHNHLMDSCNYVCKNTLLAVKRRRTNTTSTCTFLTGHFDRQVPHVADHLLCMLRKWPMADRYIDP